MIVMEKNYSSTDRSASFDRTLSVPHFDDEATLLSARPVVPLHEVKVVTGSRRRVVFGLTILAAILVGAISATLLAQRGQNSQRAAESGVNQPTPSSTGDAGGSTSDPAEARVPVAREPDEKLQMGEVSRARDTLIKKRLTAAVSASSIKPAISRRSTKPAEHDYERAEDFENDERELRQAERRDARREARRQHRHEREQMGDDVLRIREIFEGSPRP
jgi:hypothetical protein